MRLYNSERAWRNNLRYRYGLSPDEYDKKLVDQDGVCAICQEPSERKRRLDVDHSHTTEKARGLLCMKCNVGLGAFLDDPDVLQRAADYLRRWQDE